MAQSKQKTEAHIIGEEAVKIVKGLLPVRWTPREYHPDYGIDLAIEIFEKSGQDERGRETYGTLGEHLFLQVKGVESATRIQLKVRDRINVELADPNSRAIAAAEKIIIPVLCHKLETSELVTVQRMGAAVPVLLTLVDVSVRRVFFVCLNDYIDKIIAPFDENFAEQDTKVIHIPERNEIINNDEGLLPLRFYAKRAKLMAAFAKFRITWATKT